jgi:hypothetical protein
VWYTDAGTASGLVAATRSWPSTPLVVCETPLTDADTDQKPNPIMRSSETMKVGIVLGPAASAGAAPGAAAGVGEAGGGAAEGAGVGAAVGFDADETPETRSQVSVCTPLAVWMVTYRPGSWLTMRP